MRSDDFRTFNILALSLTFVVILAASSSIAGGTLGNFSAAVIYLIFIFYLYLSEQPLVKLPRYLMMAFFLLLISFLISVIYSFLITDASNILNVLSQVIMAISFFGNILIIPQVINVRDFAYVINRISALSIIIAIPSIIMGSYTVSSAEFAPYTYVWPLREFGINVYAIESYFNFNNALSKLAIFGFFSGLIDRYENNKYLCNICIFINIFGIFFAGVRAPYVALLVILFIVFFYYNTGKRQFQLLTMGLLSITFCVYFLYILVPSLPFLSDINFKARDVMWRAHIRAFFDNPLFGVGPGEYDKTITPYVFSTEYPIGAPLGAYTRTAATMGIVGFVSYMFLLFYSVFCFTTRVVNVKQLSLLCIVILSMIIMMFDAYYLFGLNHSSFMTTVYLGYLIKELTVP